MQIEAVYYTMGLCLDVGELVVCFSAEVLLDAVNYSVCSLLSFQ